LNMIFKYTGKFYEPPYKKTTFMAWLPGLL
jgi:hypothetical protein